MIQKLLIGLSFISILCVTVSCRYLEFERYRHKYSQYKRQSESKAIVHSLGNKNISGWVHFKHVKKKGKKQTALVTAKITGLEPNKKYGFHVHEYGDCSEQGQNVGKHYNPHYVRHGLPGDEQRHLGDMGNLSTGADGTAFYNKLLNMCMWGAVGRAVVIHANVDDGQSQPSGNAGPYIACGVIGYASATEDSNMLEDESELIWEDEERAKKVSQKKGSEPSKPATGQPQSPQQQNIQKSPIFISSPPSAKSPKPAVLKTAPTAPTSVSKEVMPPKAVKSQKKESKEIKNSKDTKPKGVKSKEVKQTKAAAESKEVKSKVVDKPKETVKSQTASKPTAAKSKKVELKTSTPESVPLKPAVTPSPSDKKGAVPSSSNIKVNKKTK